MAGAVEQTGTAAERVAEFTKAVSVLASKDRRFNALVVELCEIASEISNLTAAGEPRESPRLAALKARRRDVQDDVTSVVFMATRAWER
jgi:hypothetical protein